MNPTLWIILGGAFVLAWVPLMVSWIRAYRRFRGVRLVVCPETISPETVTVDAAHAAWTSITGEAEPRLASCSRRPHDCSEKCLDQIEGAADGCLVRDRLKNWWEESLCATCDRPIGRVRWLGRRPGLIGPGGTIRTWRDLTARTLPELLSNHRPVCASCMASARTRRAAQDRAGTAA